MHNFHQEILAALKSGTIQVDQLESNVTSRIEKWLPNFSKKEAQYIALLVKSEAKNRLISQRNSF